MRRLVLLCLASLPVMAGVLFACSSFGPKNEDNPTPDSASPDETPIVEAGADSFPSPPQSAKEYDVVLDDGGTLHCWNFGLTLGSFLIGGESAVTYHPELGGYLISIAQPDPAFAQISTTIDAGKDIRVSTLRIDEKVTITGTFDAGVFTDAFAQYLGTSIDDNVPRNAIVYATEGAEINEWPQAQFTPLHGFDSLPTDGGVPLATADGPVWIETVWSDAGSVTISAGGVTRQSVYPTTTQAPTSAYTLKIGGALHGDSTPTVSVLVRSICLGFR